MLRNGSTGDDVTKLQEDLTLVGFDPGTADGIFGPKTEAAVRAFQEGAELQADGIAGPNTLGTLAEAVAEAQEPSVMEKAKQLMADKAEKAEPSVMEKARGLMADQDDKPSVDKGGLKGF